MTRQLLKHREQTLRNLMATQTHATANKALGTPAAPAGSRASAHAGGSGSGSLSSSFRGSFRDYGPRARLGRSSAAEAAATDPGGVPMVQ